MLVRGMVDHELGDHPQLAALGLLHEAAEMLHGAEIGIDAAVVGDVVAVVAAGRGIERQQPQGGDPELLQIVELLGQPDEIADAVVVAVGERLDMQLIDDRVLEPELVVCRAWRSILISGSDVHGTLRQAAEYQGRILLLIDAQAHASPFDHMPFSGEQVFNRLDRRRAAARTDLDLAEMEPELPRGPALPSAIATATALSQPPIP